MSDPTWPDDPEAAARMLRECAGLPPLNTHRDSGPWDFLMRLPDDVRARSVRPVLLRLLDDPSEEVQVEAIDALAKIHARGAYDALLAKSRTTPAGRVGDALQQKLSTTARTPSESRAAAAAVRRLASGRRPRAMHLLAMYEPDFFVDVARAYAGDDDDGRSWGHLASTVAMYGRGRLLEVLRALRGLRADKPYVMKHVAEALTYPEHHRRALVAQAGLVADDEPSPTFAECRDALEVTGWPPADLLATVAFGVGMDPEVSAMEAAMRAFAKEVSLAFAVHVVINDFPGDVNEPERLDRTVEVRSERPAFVASVDRGQQVSIRLVMDGPIDDVERTFRALRRHLAA